MRLLAPIALIILVGGLTASGSRELARGQDEGWVIRSFDVRHELQRDGTFNVMEDITVDFGDLGRHGIFRDIPVDYRYDDTKNRLIAISDVSVTDGDRKLPFETSDTRPNMRIKIGDPGKLVSGPQHYVITYTV